MEKCDALREIPQVDALLRRPELAESGFMHSVLATAARSELEAFRRRLLAGGSTETVEELVVRVLARAKGASQPEIRRVINATGVALHTNLGRAPLCMDALNAIEQAAGGYSTLEYNLEQGTRGSRGTKTEALLCELTGAEAALVVNNNAAALLLALSVFAGGEKKEIVISRGELVEIGNSFRVPDILAESGGALVEVGMTNKTHPSDYKAALNERTAAILKVHTSNYRIVGFAEDVSVCELARLAAGQEVPVVYDLGSGALLPAKVTPFPEEPTPRQALADGADIVSFSGDKLLGGPQAGILVGKAAHIGNMRRRPLFRALRPDKLTLAALEATLRLYHQPERAVREIPVLQILCAEEKTLWEKAERLVRLLRANNVSGVAAVGRERQAGGGSMPGRTMPGAAVAVPPQPGCSVRDLEHRLRLGEIPVVACIADGAVLLDVSTVAEDSLEALAGEVAKAL